MVKLTIDGVHMIAEDHQTILEAASQHHIQIPHLCYLKGVNEIGACRICVVEIAGKDKLITSCNTVVQDGMVLYTNSPKVRETRRMNVQLLLSQHDCECAYCSRSKNCSLQTISNDLGITSLPFEKQVTYLDWNQQFPLIRESNKCIKCMRCIQICEKVQHLHVWDLCSTGARTNINVSDNRCIEEANCSLCGQCITHCPVNALHVRDDTEKVFHALNDPEKICIVQVAPAVRAAWGEQIGLAREDATIGKLACALRRMGADYVFDTDFGADLTIMEEASELLAHSKEKLSDNMPLFTSCCPGWVRFLKSEYPDMVSHLSTSKSPHQMFGTIIKTYFAEKMNLNPDKLFVISIMPCVAKKHEADIPSINDSGCKKDVDVVLTTREFVRMLRAEHVVIDTLQDEALDRPMAQASGAGVIFGATGGVMEAALRSAYYMVTKQNADPDAFRDVRGMDGWKSKNFTIDEKNIRCAVVHGLGNTRKLIEAIRRKEVAYDFVEVMACPGGCSGGGGQPIHDQMELAEIRANTLYSLDAQSNIRYSHENQDILKLYEEYLQHPLSNTAQQLLHTDHTSWQMTCNHK